MSFSTRYLQPEELERIATHGICPDDCLDSSTIGISPISDTLLFIEEHKRTASTVNETIRCVSQIESEVTEGHIVVTELDTLGVSHFLSNDTLYNTYIDKEGNPYELIKRISLTVYEDAQWWDETICSYSFEI